ncbi:hypothetical protein [Paenibacillus caui]|uniref:hypothetical protein n=1 Tax=Paenibacillus caui TaxID=2873927 RepID=UPI001CA8EE23|nr:hypothetical protein [Paenibacillus caui]
MFNRRRREQGAVSAFLMMIFAAVFAFVAVFVDYSRIVALQAQTEAAIHSAVRSVLSSYEPELMTRYGLFAFGETDASYIMSKVLQDGFNHSERYDSLNLIGAKLDSSEVVLSRPLGTYPVFSQQIREQMKYKAPVNLALEIVNKLKPASMVMKEASNTMDVLGKLQKLYDRREKLIDQSFKLQKDAEGSVEELSAVIKPDQGEIVSAALGGSIDSAADSASQYEDYRTKLEEDKAREPLEKVYTLDLYRYRSDTSHVFAKVSSCLHSAAAEHDRLLKEAASWIDQARGLNEEMKRVIEESENRPEGDVYESVSKGETVGNFGSGPIAGTQEIEKIRAQSRSLLREDTFFKELSAYIQEQSSDFSRIDSSVSRLLGEKSGILPGTIDVNAFVSAVLQSGGAGESYGTHYHEVLAKEELLIQKLRAHEGEINQTEKEAAGKLKEAGSMISRLSGIKDAYREQQQAFDTLKSYYNDSLKLNEEPRDLEEAREQQGEIYDAGSGSMKGMDQLYSSLAQFMENAADGCFQAEYAADYFKEFDITQLEGLLKGNAAESAASADQFAPENQELEYILYGFHNPAGNIAAAYGEIFAMRLAIRTMEGFIVNANKGHPLLILAAALLYGVEHAVQDLLTITKTGSVQLSKYLDVPLSYRDHLRIFLLIHGASERRLSRMLALIRLNTGIDPADKSTYVSGEARTGIHLLFLPGVAKAVNAAISRQGEVEGIGYYTVKRADDSY